MNSQTQTQIITIIFILFFILSLTPISLVFYILNIKFIMYTSSIKSSSSETTLPCSYSSMDKTSTFLQKVSTITPSKTFSTASKHIPITIPARLTQAQKEAALPFLTQEPPKPKTSTSKAKVQKQIETPTSCD